MKQIILIMLLAIAGRTLAQEIKEMPLQSAVSSDIDTLVSKKPYLLKVNTDTLFIINKKGVQQYNGCLANYRDLRLKYSELNELNTMLVELGCEFSELNGNLQMLEKKYELSLQQNINTAVLLREENAQLSENMSQVVRDLQKAQTKIKQERWNSKVSKLLWGAGGLVAGVLLGGTLVAVVQN
jgi:hypothetical protein